MAKAGGGCIDEAGIARMQTLPAVAKPIERARAKVLDQRVSLVEQMLEDLAVGWRFEVERNRLLAPVDRDEIRRFTVLEWTILTGIISLLRRFDLDHACPELGEQQRAVRARQDAREVDDRDAGKRPLLSHGARFPICDAEIGQ